MFLDKMDSNKLKIDELKGASDVLEYLENGANYPVLLKFGKQQLSTNDKVRFFL